MPDEPTPEALRAQEELIRRRNERLEAAEREADPWNVTFDGPSPKGPVDEEAFLTGLADIGHDLADRLQGLKDAPIIGEAAEAAGQVLHGIADQRDRDQDGLTDGREMSIGTNPNDRDTDGDKLPDGVELDEYRSNPLRQDTDRDGVSDFDEASAGINYRRDGSVDVRITTDDIRTPRPVPTPAPGPAAPASTEPGHGPDQGPITRPSQVDPSLLASTGSEEGSITADDLLDGFRRAFQPEPAEAPVAEEGSITADDLVDMVRRGFQTPDDTDTSVPMPSGDALGGEPEVPAVPMPEPSFEPAVVEDSGSGWLDDAPAEPEIELFGDSAAEPAAIDL